MIEMATTEGRHYGGRLGEDGGAQPCAPTRVTAGWMRAGTGAWGRHGGLPLQGAVGKKW
jgi:hypothetical protein